MLLSFYTLAGNGGLSKALLVWLERDYAGIDPLKQGPFDAVVVLGGGTEIAPNGQCQLTNAGDRVALGRTAFSSRTHAVPCYNRQNAWRTVQ